MINLVLSTSDLATVMVRGASALLEGIFKHLRDLHIRATNLVDK